VSKDDSVLSKLTVFLVGTVVMTLPFPSVLTANDTPALRAQGILLEEIDRLSGTTLANANLSLSGLGRQAKTDYREALHELKTSLIEPETPFGGPSTAPFESLSTLIEAFGSLIEAREQEDMLDILSEQFENRFELVREEDIRPGTQWFETFHRDLNKGGTFRRHHQLITNLTGLVLSERLSPSVEYRLRLYTLKMERLFPELLFETVGDRVEGKHATRIYFKLFEEVTTISSGLKNKVSAWSNLRSLVRGHGFILKQLQRLGHESAVSRQLLRLIEKEFQIRRLSSRKVSGDRAGFQELPSRPSR
jgi:hypothetical protein